VPAVVVVQARQAVLMEPLKAAMARHHQFLVRRSHTQAVAVAALLILLNQVAQVAVGLAQMTQATWMQLLAQPIQAVAAAAALVIMVQIQLSQRMLVKLAAPVS
jgi:hypothetical protein